jgi:uncharacterized protein YlaI
MNESTKELCTQCNKPVQDSIYALYSKQSPNESKEPLIKGFLCKECSSKLKVKPIRGVNGLKTLDQLKGKLFNE